MIAPGRVALLVPPAGRQPPGEQRRRPRQSVNVRTRRAPTVIPPQTAALPPAYVTPRPRFARRIIPKARGSRPTPVPAQKNPPYPFNTQTQSRRLRGMRVPHRRTTIVVGAQQNPPYPVNTQTQRRRPRSWFLYRDRPAPTVIPPQVAAVASPLVPRLGRRIVAAFIRRGELTPPPRDRREPLEQRRRPRRAVNVRTRPAPTVIPPQVVVIAPAYVTPVGRAWRRIIPGPHSRRTTVVPTQTVAPASPYVPRPSRRATTALLRRRGINTGTVTEQTAPTPAPNRTRRQAAVNVRDRPAPTVIPPQVVVIASPLVPRLGRRITAAFVRRGDLTTLPSAGRQPLEQRRRPRQPSVNVRDRPAPTVIPPQTVVPPPAYTPHNPRARRRLIANRIRRILGIPPIPPVVNGPTIPGRTLIWNEPSTLTTTEPSSTTWREPVALNLTEPPTTTWREPPTNTGSDQP